MPKLEQLPGQLKHSMMQDVRVYNTGSADYTRVGAGSLDT